MDKIRKEWPHDSCPECGSELYILTDCEEGQLVYDGDEAHCDECKMCVGAISIEDGDDDEIGRAWVNTFN
jgi:hypothetical protein